MGQGRSGPTAGGDASHAGANAVRLGLCRLQQHPHPFDDGLSQRQPSALGHVIRCGLRTRQDGAFYVIEPVSDEENVITLSDVAGCGSQKGAVFLAHGLHGGQNPVVSRL